MVVYVLNKHGKPLMPCSPCKARKLLKQGKAKVKKWAASSQESERSRKRWTCFKKICEMVRNRSS